MVHHDNNLATFQGQTFQICSIKDLFETTYIIFENNVPLLLLNYFLQTKRKRIRKIVFNYSIDKRKLHDSLIVIEIN